jgi:hypothetical protein
MLQRCNPQIVEKAHLEARSWRKAAQALNNLYGVSLSFAAWRDYASGRRDIADPETRVRLMLPPRACPFCGHKHTTRKPTKSKQIRVYGYPVEKAKTFVEVIELHNAPR